MPNCSFFRDVPDNQEVFVEGEEVAAVAIDRRWRDWESDGGATAAVGGAATAAVDAVDAAGNATAEAMDKKGERRAGAVGDGGVRCAADEGEAAAVGKEAAEGEKEEKIVVVEVKSLVVEVVERKDDISDDEAAR